MKRLILMACVLLLCHAQGVAQPVAERPVLTSEGAMLVAEAAIAEAMRNDWRVVIVVVDAGGHPFQLQRMEGVQLASLEIARRKARTAALYRRPSRAFADRLAEGSEAVHALPDAIPLEGGLPIVVDGVVIGAIGVSGVQGHQDAQIAQAGLDALIESLGE